MRFYVYILLCSNLTLYVGYTENLVNRLSQHAHGLVRSTKNRRPVLLVHYEYFIGMQDAKSREEYLKSGPGRNQLKQFLKHTLLDLHALS